jgi:hypothetical protein
MIMGMMMLTILNTKKPKTNINNGKKKWQMWWQNKVEQ